MLIRISTLSSLFILSILLTSTATVSSFKILVYSLQFGQSHIFYMGKIADILTAGGHEVVFYQHELFDEVKDNGTSLAKVIIRKRDFEVPTLDNVWEFGGDPNEELKMYETVGQSMSTACYHQLKDDQLISDLRNHKFDLAIGEHFDICAYALFELIGIKKYISAYAAPMYPQALELLGHPITTSYIPTINNYDGTYWERFKAFMLRPLSSYVYGKVFENPVKEAVKKALGWDFDFNAAFVKSSYAFVNVDEHLTYQQPTSQKIIYIGGITQENIGKEENVPACIKSLFETTKDPIVLVSFGTVAKAHLMPNETKQILADTFAKYPNITFLVKFDNQNDHVFGNVKNIVTEKWIPQKYVLGHSKTIGFITHGGLNSVSEAAFHGVPTICVPLFGDQERNCRMSEAHDITITLPRSDLTETTLTNTVERLLKDTVMSSKAKVMSTMMKTKPFKAKDRVLGYVEHAIKFDTATVLDLQSRHLNSIAYYGIDVYLPVVSGLLFTLYLIVKLLAVIVRLLFKQKKE